MTAKGGGLAREVSTGHPLVSDPAQLDEFYRRFYLPLVRRATWKYHLEKEDARDVVQEAFVVALAKLDPKKNPKAWLIQVVDHLSANFQRKAQRRARLVCRWYSGESVSSSSTRCDERLDRDGVWDSNDHDD